MVKHAAVCGYQDDSAAGVLVVPTYVSLDQAEYQESDHCRSVEYHG